ncbi:hypothetical protein [Ferruginibacter sp. HRS2-29]|uniref:hypothetical protein n=1 Tax=Ferruginibacter sp. HRS2-29 TaxID=2487334 RepID=UPI0020CE6B79|nr:hypothetical protein [Ferruginibacter sp. HRS2-29]MCP9750748.1 phosphoglyceromutase [Ferruginibacter sp. HRS2-29]
MEKKLLLLLFSFACVFPSFSQQGNVILITMDGMRWQEIFTGADTSLLNSKKFTSQDSLTLVKKYAQPDANDRRKMLMPFLWNTIAKDGQIYGNRKYNNFVNVKNRYWFSYPGYNEIFTGYPDTLVNSNKFPANYNENILEFINKQPAYKNKVASFGSWDAFRRILNKERSGIYINDGFDDVPADKSSPAMDVLNKAQHLLPAIYGSEERLDAMTGLMALEYMKLKHPKVLHISLGETDEFAHEGKYDYYLEAAQHNDAIIRLIWEQVQSDPFYKNNTTLLLTTDHGRGLNDLWTSHWSDVPNSNEIWFAVIGKNIAAKGEMKNEGQLYQQQFAQTIAYLTGIEFKTNHPVGEKISILFK